MPIGGSSYPSGWNLFTSSVSPCISLCSYAPVELMSRCPARYCIFLRLYIFSHFTSTLALSCFAFTTNLFFLFTENINRCMQLSRLVTILDAHKKFIGLWRSVCSPISFSIRFHLRSDVASILIAEAKSDLVPFHLSD